MNSKLIPVLGMLALAATCAEAAALRDEIEQFARAATPIAGHSATAARPVRFGTNETGYLRTLRPPKGFHFQVDSSLAHEPIAAARAFLAKHGRLFGADGDGIGFEPTGRRQPEADGMLVGLQQTYAGVPLQGGWADLLVNAQGGVTFVLANVQSVGAAKPPSTVPTLSIDAALAKAREVFKPASPDDHVVIQEPRLVFISPAAGAPPKLAWEVKATHRLIRQLDSAILDAHTGDVLLKAPEVRAKARQPEPQSIDIPAHVQSSPCGCS